ncbi:hypothetical protein KP509_12G031300 [Ceratopteris richardii]|uniref:Red chlorophyll catabolite reductase n=1 Tax=Ceratopteris richardii TaxID=49495 RepID=A0A8T2TMI5_CERRI|nr:hypothetical protein KP509_12G031300 [Ceratopteris richardii]
MENVSHMTGKKTEWVHFPFLSEAATRLMREIADTIDEELGPLLCNSQTPSDVTHFKNSKRTAEGSVVLRAGKDKTQISFVLGSWLRCKLTAGTLDIATIIIMVGHEIDTPHFMFELIQNDNNSVILLLDFLPRKDVVLNPDYLKRYYDDTGLEKLRKGLDKIPQSKVYVPSSLYVRSLVSPTALLYKFKNLIHSDSNANDTGNAEDLDALVKEIVYPTAKGALMKWLDAFRNKVNKITGEESLQLLERDNQIKEKGIEIDLSSNMPRLFGHEITHKVIQAYRKGV